MVEDRLVIMEAWALLANVTVVHHIHSEVCHTDSNLIISLSFATCSWIQVDTRKDPLTIQLKELDYCLIMNFNTCKPCAPDIRLYMSLSLLLWSSFLALQPQCIYKLISSSSPVSETIFFIFPCLFYDFYLSSYNPVKECHRCKYPTNLCRSKKSCWT